MVDAISSKEATSDSTDASKYLTDRGESNSTASGAIPDFSIWSDLKNRSQWSNINCYGFRRRFERVFFFGTHEQSISEDFYKECYKEYCTKEFIENS